jgi:hypothetical protein
LTVSEFETLVPAFQHEYDKGLSLTHTAAGKPRRRKAGGGNKSRLATPEDRLLFISVYQKTYPLQTVLGVQFGMSQGQANEWIHRLLMPILERTLVSLNQMSERDGTALATHEPMPTIQPDFLIDGTERRRQRPKNAEKQRETYSGKKAHTDKNLILANAHTERVDYLSSTYCGKTHDKKMADQEAIQYPRNATLVKDTGFQGYEPLGVLTFQPKKKPKGKELIDQAIKSRMMGECQNANFISPNYKSAN